MTRKDYELLERVLRDALGSADPVFADGAKRVAILLADEIGRTHPAFDRFLFLRNAGVI